MCVCREHIFFDTPEIWLLLREYLFFINMLVCVCVCKMKEGEWLARATNTIYYHIFICGDYYYPFRPPHPSKNRIPSNLRKSYKHFNKLYVAKKGLFWSEDERENLKFRKFPHPNSAFHWLWTMAQKAGKSRLWKPKQYKSFCSLQVALGEHFRKSPQHKRESLLCVCVCPKFNLSISRTHTHKPQKL